jgi:tRNA threonylcarbamoyladenosine modification (KEOPS) complex  Pcc1 subunit
MVVGLQVTANGEELFDKLPEGWKVEKSFVVPKDQTAAISRRLGGRISRLTNTVLSIEGRSLQVNVIRCPTNKQAEKIYKAVLEAHNGLAASAVRNRNIVVEFAKSDDVELMNRARRALGLPEANLSGIAEKLIRSIPAEWEVEESFIVSEDQTVAIATKLGGRIKKLSNTIFSVQGRRFQVNVIECATPREAEKIYESILEMKADPAFCRRYDNLVVEFVGDEVNLAKKAPYELGFEAKPEDINAKVAKLNLKTANLSRVIKIFGEPIEYTWNNQTFSKNNLPSTYSLDYSNGFSVLMSNGKVEELRHSQPGYKFRGKLQVGSLLQQVLEVIGKPKQIVEGKRNEFKDGVLYKDIDGKQGCCYYARSDRGVRTFFLDYKVSALYVTRSDFSARKRSRDTAKAPAAATPQPTAITKAAEELVNLLANGDYEKAVENFDTTMKNALPAEKLQQVWLSLIAQAGPFVKQVGTRKEKILQYDVVFVTCKFEKTVLDAKVVFNSDKQISGLFFVPSK